MPSSLTESQQPVFPDMPRQKTPYCTLIDKTVFSWIIQQVTEENPDSLGILYCPLCPTSVENTRLHSGATFTALSAPHLLRHRKYLSDANTNSTRKLV